MYHQRTTHFDDTQKMIARAMIDGGSTDQEVADAIGTSVNNIIDFRRREGIGGHVPDAGKMVEAIPTPPVVRHIRPAAAGVNRSAPTIRESQQERQKSVGSASESMAFESYPAAAVQPAGDNALEIGTQGGKPAFIDLEELLTTRLLVQGNSGSGKSHLLRKVIEESAGIVQQIIIDPEGDFVGLGEVFGHTVIDVEDKAIGKLGGIAARARQYRGSIVLNLEALAPDRQMDAAAAFLTGLFEAPREHWFPALVFVDEAHLFAPAATATGEEDKDTRKAALVAMTNLMCRGRKRGLAGVLATQRLAKLAKNVAAEASNFLMGRTFLDIDIKRAAEALGVGAKEAERIRELGRGQFLALGPAIARRPVQITIGSVLTASANTSHGLVDLPTATPEELRAAMLGEDEDHQTAPATFPPLRAVA